MRIDLVPLLALDLAVVVVLALLLGRVAARLGQPPVIGEIMGGILLGPTLLGGTTQVLFPPGVLAPLQVVANVGVCVFMFLVGAHLRPALVQGMVGIAGTVALGSVAVPLGLGALLGWGLLARRPDVNPAAFVLFLGTAMAVTALPVLARILADRGLVDRPVGGLALACAAVDDVLAWTLLAVVTALVGSAAGAQTWRLALAVPFVLVMVGVVRPALARLASGGRAGPGRAAAVVAVLATGLALSAGATEWMGLHQIFGAFLFGAVLPREIRGVLPEQAWSRVQQVNAAVLLPVFFVIGGIKVDLSRVDAAAIGLLALILLVAIGGKFAGTYLAARAMRLDGRLAMALATLLNTRGLTELIALTVGLQIGVLDQQLYSLMVVMALVTTAMTGIVLRLVSPDVGALTHRAAVPARRGRSVGRWAMVDRDEQGRPKPLGHADLLREAADGLTGE